MAARQREDLVRQLERAKTLQNLLRIDRAEGRVVARPDQEAAHIAALEPGEIRGRADHGPIAPQFVLAHMAGEPFAHVLSGEPRPNYVREVHGDVIEDSRAHPRIVGGRDESDARAQAGPQDADSRVAALFQPVQARPRIDDGLAAGVDGAADVGGAVVVGSLARLSQVRSDRGYRSERLKIIDPEFVPEQPSAPNIPL